MPPEYPASRDEAGAGGRLILARSLHVGGVSVGLGDGSTRFVTTSHALAIWQHSATIRESEVVEPLP